MKTQVALLAFLVITFPFVASAQTRPGSGGNKTSITKTPPPPSSIPGRGSIFLSGRVVLQDGSKLTEPVAIQTICRGQKRTETYSDSHGNFSFELGNRNALSGAAGLMDAETSSSDVMSSKSINQRDFRDCELQAVLPGFSSESIPLSSKISDFTSTDI